MEGISWLGIALINLHADTVNLVHSVYIHTTCNKWASCTAGYVLMGSPITRNQLPEAAESFGDFDNYSTSTQDWN